MSERADSETTGGDVPSNVYARITDAVFALDSEWRFTYLNEEAEQLLERDANELLGTDVWDELPAMAGTTFQRKYERAMETQESLVFEEFYQPQGSWYESRAYPEERGLSVTLRDVTDEIQRKSALRKREEALQRAYEIIADPDMSFSDQVNALLRVVRKAVGTDFATLSQVDQASGTYVFESVEVPDPVDLEAGDSTPLSELPNCAHVVETEKTLVLKDVEAEAPELVDPTWGISCYVGAPVSVGDDVYGTFCFYGMEARSEDFTEWDVTFVELLSNWVSSELTRQHIHDQLEQQNEQLKRQNEQLEEFTSVVSHDLRNPLNILSIYLNRAEETGDPADFEQCFTAVDRMNDLITNLLELAEVGEQVSNLEPVELESLTREAWESVATADATLTVDADRTVLASANRVQQLFENLFRNAAEHGGDEVEVTVGDLGDGFYVADDGPGISEENREQVFDQGFSTTEEGTGFGLNITKKIADAHGWRVSVAESRDGGVRFEFTGVEAA